MKQPQGTLHEADHGKPRNDRFQNMLEKAENAGKPLAWVIGSASALIAITVAAVWLLLEPRVNEAAKKALLSPEVLRDISARIRPYAVIELRPNNAPGSFKYDDGAGDIIESATFSQAGSNSSMGVLTLGLKKFVPVAPFIRPLSPGIYIHSFSPTNKFDWAYEIRTGFMNFNGIMGYEELSPSSNYSFLVELFPK
jgi:hypothetical protein